MRAALRPYVTAGIALTAVGVIAAAPVAPPPTVQVAKVSPRTGSAPVALTAKVLTLSPSDSVIMEDTLLGSMCQGGNQCVKVNYLPFWGNMAGEFTYGMNALERALHDPANAGPKIIYAHSSGARVAQQWLERYGDNYDPDVDGDLSFVFLGNPNREYGGSNVLWQDVLASENPFPDTPYHVVDLTRQYDPAGDFPNNYFSPFYWLAQANATSAFFFTHLNYNKVDISDPNNIRWTETNDQGGSTEYIFVPNQRLPLLEGFRMSGAGSVADVLDEPLRQLVEMGYNRKFPPGVPKPTYTKSFANVIPNAINGILNVPMAFIEGVERFTAAMERSESWWVYSPVNVLGWDPPNFEMTKGFVDMLLPFKPLSTPAGIATNWFMAANMPMHKGCSGFPPCPDPWSMLNSMFKVPAWAFYGPNGYTFPKIINPISDGEWAAGQELGEDGEEVAWSGQNVKLDPYAGLASVLDYLVSKPTKVEFPTLGRVITAFLRLGKALWDSWYPFVPQSTIWNPKMSLMAYLVRPFAPILCPSCNPKDPFLAPETNAQTLNAPSPAALRAAGHDADRDVPAVTPAAFGPPTDSTTAGSPAESTDSDADTPKGEPTDSITGASPDGATGSDEGSGATGDEPAGDPDADSTADGSQEELTDSTTIGGETGDEVSETGDADASDEVAAGKHQLNEATPVDNTVNAIQQKVSADSGTGGSDSTGGGSGSGEGSGSGGGSSTGGAGGGSGSEE